MAAHRIWHATATALRVAAHAFAKHDPDLNSSTDESDKAGQRLSLALLDAACAYARVAEDADVRIDDLTDEQIGELVGELETYLGIARAALAIRKGPLRESLRRGALEIYKRCSWSIRPPKGGE